MTTRAVPARPGLPIAEVSRRLGVPMPTLRSWERRYQMPHRAREVGTHRRYSASELHGLRLMRDQIARGTQARLAADSVRELLGRAGPPAEFIADVLEAAERGDPVAVRAHLSRAHTTLGLAVCLDDVLLPAMQQVGLWWQAGRCDIEQEQVTTRAARNWLDALIAYAPAPHRPTPIVLACGPKDLHTIGVEALWLLLRDGGWPCRTLGARTSVAALTAAIHESHAAAVVVVSHVTSGREAAIASLQAAKSRGVAVFYAGNAFSAVRSRRGLPGTYLGTRLQDAYGQIDAKLG